ncbi:tRNA uracil 4-sulfurtransferase ThiI [Sediminivirga luteola]|uniref:tRNA uracil 4-sulfurtransferase ThiI n=1 Tax=Sediminivirga luteola TaxID=1774748 RepID=UPI001F57C675|nr:tRNA 4-thiouridine(8) synthase ThiI [Sediminivirga luteola]
MTAERCLLLKHGELFLKGANRPAFARRLVRNVRAALPPECGRVRAEARNGFTVLYPERAPEALAAGMRDIAGVSVIDVALRVDKTAEAFGPAALAELRRRFGQRLRDTPRSFAVVVRRRDKTFPLTSTQLAARLGAELQAATGWPVNLGEPEVTVSVEIDRHEAFVSAERLRGLGGLPVGSSGTALVLLSGGFDSPVAAHRAMRRGLRCEFIHFSGAPYTDPSSTYKAYALVRELTRFQPRARLWVAPLGPAQRTLASSADPALRTIAQRRLMVRIGEELAGRVGAEALVMGDSLGQVASQTVSNIASVDEACALPVLRPLLGWDKEEIIAEARRIGTAEISALPDEDCCRLLAPLRPAVRSDPRILARAERRAGVDELVGQTLDRLQEHLVSIADRRAGLVPPAAG